MFELTSPRLAGRVPVAPASSRLGGVLTGTPTNTSGNPLVALECVRDRESGSDWELVDGRTLRHLNLDTADDQMISVTFGQCADQDFVLHREPPSRRRSRPCHVASKSMSSRALPSVFTHTIPRRPRNDCGPSNLHAQRPRCEPGPC